MSQQNNENKKILNGALYLTASVIIVKIIGFIYKVPLSYILNDEGMGYFNSAYTVFTFFYMICSGGIPKAISIIIAESDMNGDKERVSTVFIAAFRFFSFIGILCTVLLAVFSGLISSLIGNDLAAFSILCIAPSLTFVSASGVMKGYLNGTGNVKHIAYAEVIEGIVKFVSGLLLAIASYKSNCSVPIISAFTITGVSLGSFICSLYMYVNIKKQKAKEKVWQNNAILKFDKTVVKDVLRISLPITISSAIMGMGNIIDLSILISALKSNGYTENEAVALYGNYTTLVIPLLNAVSALITPLGIATLRPLAGLYANGGLDEHKNISETVIKICMMIVVPVSFAFIYFSEPILDILFKDSSASVAAPLLVIIAPSVIFLPMLTLINNVIESSSKTKYSLISILIGTVLKLIIEVALLVKTDLGISAAPLSTDVSYAVSFVTSVVFLRMFVNPKIKLNNTVIIPMFLSFVSMTLSKFIYSKCVFFASEFINLALCGIIFVSAYLLLSFVFMRSDVVKFLTFVRLNKKN